MIQIDDTIISFDVFEKQFVCDLEHCKGACCVEGDSGAPLEKSEMKILDKIFPVLRPYLSPKGIEAIEAQGCHVIDFDGDDTTPLIDGKECAYSYFDEKKICKCAIEQAYLDGKVDFKKPISCHLYPIRLKEYANFTAVNYDKWELCGGACILGEKLKVPVYVFLKEPLIRKYGTEWYEQLQIAAEELPELKKGR